MRVARVDEFVAVADAGIDDDRAVRVVDDERVDGERRERVVLGMELGDSVDAREPQHIDAWHGDERGHGNILAPTTACPHPPSLPGERWVTPITSMRR